MIASSVYQSSASKEVNQFDLICFLLREKNFTDAETISMMDFAELERMKPKSALAVRSIPSKSSSNVCGTGNMTHEACVMSKSKSMPNLMDGYKQPEPCYSSLSELSYDMDVEAESCSSLSVLSLGEAANWFYDSSSLNFSHNLSEGEFFNGNFAESMLEETLPLSDSLSDLTFESLNCSSDSDIFNVTLLEASSECDILNVTFMESISFSLFDSFSHFSIESIENRSDNDIFNSPFLERNVESSVLEASLFESTFSTDNLSENLCGNDILTLSFESIEDTVRAEKSHASQTFKSKCNRFKKRLRKWLCF